MQRVLLFLLLLAACTQEKSWTYQEVKASAPQFHSQSLSFSSNAINGIGVEILQGSFGIVGYLNVTSCTIPSIPDAPDQAIISLQAGEEQLVYRGKKMEGSQRVRLPEEALSYLISSLQNNHSVTIYLDGYSTEVTPKKFKKLLS